MKGTRLLSPHRSRLYPNAMTGAFIGAAGSLVKASREGMGPGQPDGITWEALLRAGWSEYRGTAVTDDKGFIVPGTDLTNNL